MGQEMYTPGRNLVVSEVGQDLGVEAAMAKPHPSGTTIKAASRHGRCRLLSTPHTVARLICPTASPIATATRRSGQRGPRSTSLATRAESAAKVATTNMESRGRAVCMKPFWLGREGRAKGFRGLAVRGCVALFRDWATMLKRPLDQTRRRNRPCPTYLCSPSWSC